MPSCNLVSRPGRACLRLAVLAAFALAACSPAELPEAGTRPAVLYAERCGTCHILYRPQLLTADMWVAMVGRMEIEMKRRGRPLDPADKAEIIAYLTRHAGVR